ncbi:MAG TPA: efflux RND transporter periplasmic adaptor subunit [Gemmatimonadales bacterium]|nr:efflux RND transporter periplasmic adaptor subunit [Gemmatimonadales bacterium]
MSRRTKLTLLIGFVVVGVAGVVGLSAAAKGKKATEVRLEAVAPRDLVATVTASGRIDAKRSVDVTADITGRITEIAVKEGDLVKQGQFLLQIDPSQYRAELSRAQALLASSEAGLVQARANKDQAQRSLSRAQELQRTGNNLISTEQVEQAQTAYDVSTANYNSAMAQTAQARAGVQTAQTDLNRTRLFAPISGRVVRLPVEVGEVAVPGTFSRDNALLMTIADLSTILAKVNVDETDVIKIGMGDSVQVKIDAYPDTSFTGRVTMISNSAQISSGTLQSAQATQAVDFDVEVTLDHPPADIRPDLSASAKVITATRKQALAVPIIALTVRQHTGQPTEGRATTLGAGTPAAGAATPADSAHKPKETEGVFVVDHGIATFRPVKVGIAGEEYFEVLSGLQAGDTIVAGTYQAIRDLKDSSRVRSAQGGGPGNGAKPAGSN